MRRMLVFLALILISCFQAHGRNGQAEQNAKPNAGNLACFDAAWKRVRDVYPFLEYKNIDWDSIYAVYKSRVEKAGEDEFDQLLNDMLAELKDVHVYHNKVQGHQKYTYESPSQARDKRTISRGVIRRYFDTELTRTKSKSAMYGMTAENIGYIYFYDLMDHGLEEEFPGILEYLKNTKGLILDFRTRQGGTYQVVQSLVQRFLTAPLEKPKMYILENIEQPPFQPLTDTLIYTKPIVILINGVTISAGELISEVLKQLPNVTAVGDTTAGGGGCASGHTPQAEGPYRLPCNRIIFIPTGYFLRYDGSHFEWNGVSPDIRVEQTEADVKIGKDRQLEYAINMLK